MDHHEHDDRHDHAAMGGVNAMAVSATLHCLTGCAIGEIAGLMIGTAAGLANGWTIALSVALAFVFGYTLSTLPLVKAGLSVGAALTVVLAADTLSIATMEVVDNLVMAVIPGAMGAGLANVVFWVGMMIALTAAFCAAYPVNRYLLQRGKGHALLHEHHQGGAEARRRTTADPVVRHLDAGGRAGCLHARRPGGVDRYLSSLLIRRSASGLPPVWQVGQYCRLESANDTSSTVSPQTGHGLPVCPCTARLDFFSPLSSLACRPRERSTASPRVSRTAAYNVASSSSVSPLAGLKGDIFAACRISSE